MPRGVMTIAETREEAEAQALGGIEGFRVVSSREMDLSGLPPLRTGPLPKHWVVVVEHEDPDEEAKLPQVEDPARTREREARLWYLQLATDPELVVSGRIEEFPCPACGERARLELPPISEARDPENTQCPECKTPLRRAKGRLQWGRIPTTNKPYPQCSYCPARADSREHVIPHWISKRFGITEQFSAEDAFLVGVERRTQPISFASYRARVMCGDCNRHFKHLEDAVIPLLVPMAQGLTLSLDPKSQELLALWASKTAIALVAAIPETRDAIPTEHGQAVRAGRVAANTWVAFFPWHGGPVFGTGQPLILEDGNANGREAYSAFLAFAGIAFYVIGLADPPKANETIGGERAPLVQFWPPIPRRIDWPMHSPADNRILPGLLGFVPLRRV